MISSPNHIGGDIYAVSRRELNQELSDYILVLWSIFRVGAIARYTYSVL